MDKNIAALMRNDARTIQVNYDVDLEEPKRRNAPDLHFTQIPPQKHVDPTYGKERKQRSYTYVTDLKVAQGDLVIVDAAGEMKLATVIHVDDDVDIEPNSNIAYKWVVAKVDLTHYEETMAKNKQITDAVAEAYRNNLRKSFAQQILGGMPEEQRLALEKLTNG